MEAPQRSGWWSRSWKWAVPAGCLGLLLTCGLGVGVLVFGVQGALQGSDAYVHGMMRLQQSPAAAAALGAPIESGWTLNGRVEQTQTSGQARMAVPVHGPRGAGTLRLFARRKPNGRWEFSRLLLEVDGRSEPVDLLAESDARQPPQPPPAGAPDAGQP